MVIPRNLKMLLRQFQRGRIGWSLLITFLFTYRILYTATAIDKLVHITGEERVLIPLSTSQPFNKPSNTESTQINHHATRLRETRERAQGELLSWARV